MPLTRVPPWKTDHPRYSYVSGRACFRLHLHCFVVALRPVRPQRRQDATPDFTASSLFQQCFLESPAVVRLQVRSMMTVRQHEDAEEPGETSSTGGNVTPPSILANDLMLYWRCADGDGLSFRDSDSCGRVGTLMGDTSWSEPLPADEPLAAADEW